MAEGGRNSVFSAGVPGLWQMAIFQVSVGVMVGVTVAVGVIVAVGVTVGVALMQGAR